MIRCRSCGLEVRSAGVHDPAYSEPLPEDAWECNECTYDRDRGQGLAAAWVIERFARWAAREKGGG